MTFRMLRCDAVFDRISRSASLGLILAGFIGFLAGNALNAAEARQLASPQAAVSADAVQKHIEYLASPELLGRGPQGKPQAREYIIRHFQDSGLLPLFSGTWLQMLPDRKALENTQRAEGHNIGGFVPGTDPNLKDEWIIVNAHYDHLGVRGGRIYPGADDNASGVAMLLEVSRRIAAHPLRRSVAFVAFDCEESLLWGSRWFVAHAPMPLEQIKLSITADMIGRSLGGFQFPNVFVLGAEHSAEIREVLHSEPVPDGLEVNQLGADMIGSRSDYAPFRDEHIPFLFFSTGEHPDYHSPRDVASKVDFAKTARISTFIDEVVTEVGNAARAPEWSAAEFQKVEEAKTVHQITSHLLDAEANGEVKLSGVQRFFVSQLASKSAYMIRVNRVSDEERKWLARSAQMLLLSVF